MVLSVPSITPNPEVKSVLPDYINSPETKADSEINSPLFETNEAPIKPITTAEADGVTQDAKPGEIVDEASKHRVKKHPIFSKDKVTTIADGVEDEFRTKVDDAHNNSAHEQHS
jgi:hypothetical protein